MKKTLSILALAAILSAGAPGLRAQEIKDPGTREYMSVVNLDGHYGVINEQGKWVIPPQLDAIFGSSPNGYILVVRNGRFGYVDKYGKWLIPARFDNADLFTDEGLARVQLNGKCGKSTSTASSSFSLSTTTSAVFPTRVWPG